jgi:hypothetical protein
MQIVLNKLRSHLAKGPLVELFPDGKAIRLDQKVPKHVEDKYAYVLLEKYPDLISKIPRKAVAKPETPEKRAKAVTKNKMVSKYRDKVEAINRGDEDGAEIERPSS